MHDLTTETENILSPKRFWVYTDGSAVTQGERIGTYSSMILLPDGTREMVAGASNWTSIDRMELLAINASLYYIRSIALKGITVGASVQVICDRENIVKSACGEYGRNANQDLWAQFDQIARGLTLSITHMSRNGDPAQAQADAICDMLRADFVKSINSIRTAPGFQNLTMTRA